MYQRILQVKLYRNKKNSLLYGVLLAAVLLSCIPLGVNAGGDALVVQSTTSTANSGFYDHVLPLFERAHGIKVNVVAVGTGQAIRNAIRGDGDVLLVHAESDEKQFVQDGWGLKRFGIGSGRCSPRPSRRRWFTGGSPLRWGFAKRATLLRWCETAGRRNERLAKRLVVFAFHPPVKPA